MFTLGAYFVAAIYSFGLVGLYILALLFEPQRFHTKIQTRPDVLDQYGQHGFVQLNNVTIHYVETGNRTGPVILFIHGFPGFWYTWRYQLQAFNTSYWCVAMDTRGYNLSEKPAKITDYTMDVLVDDLKQFIDKLGRQKVTLIAHDLGGVIGWAFLAKYPHILDKYVFLNAPILEPFTHLIETNVEQFMKTWYVFAFQMPYLPELFFQQNDYELLQAILKSFVRNVTTLDLNAYKYSFSVPGTLTSALNYYRAIIRAGSSSITFDHVNVPGLFIFGANDHALSLKIVEQVTDHVPNVNVAVISNASHFVNEDDPREVNRVIWKFLDS